MKKGDWGDWSLKKYKWCLVPTVGSLLWGLYLTFADPEATKQQVLTWGLLAGIWGFNYMQGKLYESDGETLKALEGQSKALRQVTELLEKGEK